MVLGEITNAYRREGSYSPSCIIPAKYRPAILRGHKLSDQAPRSEFEAKRKAGDTNLDIWLDGSIYPVNPMTQKPPAFQDLKGLLCFVGDGANGLLGYTSSLCTGNEYAKRCAEFATSVERLGAAKEEAESRFEAERLGRAHDRFLFQHHSATQEDRLHNLDATYQVRLRRLNAEISMHIEDKARHLTEQNIDMENARVCTSQEIERLRADYETKIKDLELELLTTQNDLTTSNLQVARLQGPQIIGRKRKNLSNLARGGGRAKQVKAQIRELLQFETVSAIRSSNTINSTRKRLCGASEEQSATGVVLSEILSQGEARSLMAAPKFRKVAAGVTNAHLKAIGNIVDAHEILSIEDENGVSHRGYNKLIQIMKNGVRQVDKNLNFKFMPTAFRVGMLRTELNSKLQDYVGEYFHISQSWEVPVSPNEDLKKRTGPTHLHLDTSNNLFVDLITVQQTMVRHYGFTVEEVGSGPLIFVLKMDEAEIVKGQKQERMAITIMNRALNNPHLLKSDPQFFSVQSEREIWPIGTFQVVKESHDCLKWVLEQTPIPSVIDAQSSGKKLVVENIGEFSVEWHLACDMKTVKCLYGFSHGANSTHSCIYCWQSKGERRQVTSVEAFEPWRHKQPWNGGLFSKSVPAKPSRGPGGGPNGDGKWSPILNIPIERVHFCTLHAMCRVIEKIIHLQICYVWLIKDQKERKEAVAAMEKALSKAGLCGGFVVLTRDPKLSGANSDLPSKLSFNGAKCRKMFQPSTWSNFDAVWKDICDAERNNTNQGQSKVQRQEVWLAFTELLPYFQCMSKPSQKKTSGFFLSTTQRRDYKRIVERWGRAYLAAFGEGSVTHYVHVIVKHSSWFVMKYGSLSVWSTQGMEKSHYEAKTTYSKHTQHFGTQQHHLPIVQTFQWWYRVIQERERKQEKARTLASSPIVIAARALTQKRRQIYFSSTGSQRHAEWRNDCVRVQSRYVSRESLVANEDNVE